MAPRDAVPRERCTDVSGPVMPVCPWCDATPGQRQDRAQRQCCDGHEASLVALLRHGSESDDRSRPWDTAVRAHCDVMHADHERVAAKRALTTEDAPGAAADRRAVNASACKTSASGNSTPASVVSKRRPDVGRPPARSAQPSEGHAASLGDEIARCPRGLTSTAGSDGARSAGNVS